MNNVELEKEFNLLLHVKLHEMYKDLPEEKKTRVMNTLIKALKELLEDE